MAFARFVLLIALALCAGCAGVRERAGTAPPTVVLISIDAFRSDYLDRGITPNLSRIARDGVRAQWMNPSYPSLTFPNHYTLVTGLRPDHHGIIHNDMRDAALGHFKVGDAPSTLDSRWWGGEPIWVGAEKAGIRTASWGWPGSAAMIDGVRSKLLEPFDDDTPFDARVDVALRWLSLPAGERPRLVTLYFEKVDENGHAHGPDSPEVNAALRETDAAIGRLLDGLARTGQLTRTDIIVVSDHGMAPVLPNHVIDVASIAAPDEADFNSTGQVLEIAPKPGHAATLEQRLVGTHAAYDCWRKHDLPERWHYGSNPRIPDIVCQMHEGWDALPSDKFATRSTSDTRGSHGYDPTLPSMHALFVAQGPDFRAGTLLPGFDNVDVYPLLARLLRIAPAANDGDIAPLLPALRSDAP